MTEYRMLTVADDTVEITGLSAPDAQAIGAALRGDPAFDAVVPGLQSVTVQFNPLSVSIDAVKTQLATIKAPPATTQRAEVITLPATFGAAAGPDFAELCSAIGLSEDDAVASLYAKTYTVDMIGFLPGFAYMSGLDPAFDVPRRAAPRPRVPAGSIGVSAGRLGVYALPSPGGWSLIGRTDAKLFSPEADDPFLLRPGLRIRFAQP